MGKAARWFRGLLGLKRPDPSPSDPSPNPARPKDKRRWSFVKSYRDKSTPPPPQNDVDTSRPHRLHNNYYDAATSSPTGNDPNKHAIAVAAATAAVAEAAVAAAQAAAAVVRLTSSGRCSGKAPAQVRGGAREVPAAVVIQSHFRGYLARRALRALKGLVKLQALVRGHIMRKKTAETMRCMQAMLRAQARARSGRAHLPESSHSSSKSSQIHHPGPPTPEKFEQVVRAKSVKQKLSPKIRRNNARSSSEINSLHQDRVVNLGSSWSDSRIDEPIDEDRADRVLEIDTGKPHLTLGRKNLFESSHSGLLTSDQVSHNNSYTTSKDSTAHHTIPSPTSFEVVQSINPHENDDGSYCTAESDGSRSFLSGYSDCPSYMAYTESSRAKMRSLSAPKQRPQFEKSGSIKRYSIHGFGENNPRIRSNEQRVSAMHASFTSKAYPGSGRLDRLGRPVKDSTVIYYSGFLN